MEDKQEVVSVSTVTWRNRVVATVAAQLAAAEMLAEEANKQGCREWGKTLILSGGQRVCVGGGSKVV